MRAGTRLTSPLETAAYTLRAPCILESVEPRRPDAAGGGRAKRRYSGAAGAISIEGGRSSVGTP
jgi:hypothetical protein